MKTSKEVAVEELYRRYKESLHKEEEQAGLAQHHLRKWRESDCEDLGEYERYETASNEYTQIARETNILARMVLEYAFEEEETT